MRARGAGESLCRDVRTIARAAGSVLSIRDPGVPLRFTPAFMLPPAPQAEFVFGRRGIFCSKRPCLC